MRRQAKEEAKKIEKDANAKEGTVTASKHLMAGVVKHKAIKDYATTQRAWWSQVTQPWFDGKGAPRAVATVAVLDRKIELGDRARGFWSLVDDFMPDYPAIRAIRMYEMGDLFNDKEFPPPDVLRSKFAFRTAWFSLPDAEDIRVIEGIDPSNLKRLQAEAVKSEHERVARAMGLAAQRLFKVVKSMHVTMSTKPGEPGAKFNDSKLENIIEVAGLIPALNLTNDPKLNALAKEAKKLAMKSPDELREDEVKRKAAAKEAKSLADKLEGMFSPDKGEDDE
jgi:hypothetical protein